MIVAVGQHQAAVRMPLDGAIEVYDAVRIEACAITCHFKELGRSTRSSRPRRDDSTIITYRSCRADRCLQGRVRPRVLQTRVESGQRAAAIRRCCLLSSACGARVGVRQGSRGVCGNGCRAGVFWPARRLTGCVSRAEPAHGRGSRQRWEITFADAAIIHVAVRNRRVVHGRPEREWLRSVCHVHCTGNGQPYVSIAWLHGAGGSHFCRR